MDSLINLFFLNLFFLNGTFHAEMFFSVRYLTFATVYRGSLQLSYPNSPNGSRKAIIHWSTVVFFRETLLLETRSNHTQARNQRGRSTL